MHKTTQQKIDFIVNVIYGAIMIVLAYIGIRIAGLILPFIFALCMVACIYPLVRFLHKKIAINEKLLSIFVLIILYAGIGTLLAVLGVQIFLAVKDLVYQLPEYYSHIISPALEEWGNQLQQHISNLPLSQQNSIIQIQESLSSSLSGLIGSISESGISLISGYINHIPGMFIGILFTIMLTFFIAAQYESVIEFLKTQMPDKANAVVKNLRKLSTSAIAQYVVALFKMMIITFIELSIGFVIMHVSNPFGKAAGIAIFDAFPILGVGGILIPWFIIAIIQQQYRIALGLTILYVIANVGRRIIEPKIVGDQLGLNSVVSLVAMYIGYRLMGIMGMILFPIILTILLALHQDGSIRLYKEKKKEKEEMSKTDAA